MGHFICELAAASGSAVAGEGLAGHGWEPWPALSLATSGWPDVDGVFLLKLIGAIAGVLLIATQLTSLLKNVRDLREKPKAAAAAPQPFIVTMKEQFVEKETFDALKEETHNQIKEMRAYLHEGVHDLKQDLDSLKLVGQDREERLTLKLDEHWKGLTKERSVSTARLHDRIDASAQAIRNEFDAKLKEVRTDIHHVPGKMVTLLRETGAIGGGKRS